MNKATLFWGAIRFLSRILGSHVMRSNKGYCPTVCIHSKIELNYITHRNKFIHEFNYLNSIHSCRSSLIVVTRMIHSAFIIFILTFLSHSPLGRANVLFNWRFCLFKIQFTLPSKRVNGRMKIVDESVNKVNEESTTTF